MMKHSIKLLVPLVAISFAVGLASGCSKTERQEMEAAHEEKKEEKAEVKAEKQEEKAIEKDADYRDKEWNEAVKYANKGYEQLGDYDKKLNKMQPRRAKLHLEKATKDFSDALTHLAKSEVGKARQDAIDDLNSGVDELNKAYKELDEGRVDAAQLHYDEANKHFAEAADILQ
jgi:tetratricopeptide (TPR) repeat protein